MMPTLFGRDREPIFNLPMVVMLSVAAMVVIHGIRMALPEETDDLILGLFAFAPDRYFARPEEGAPWPGGLAADIWSPFTYALLHNDLLHLISNCTVFAALGNVLARRMTALRFLLFCAVMAPVSACGELVILAYQSAPVIGVSGVICAMMGGLARFAFPAPSIEDEADIEPVEDLAYGSDRRRVSARRIDADPALLEPESGHRPVMRSSRPTIAPVIETLRRPKVIQFILAFAAMNIVLVIAAPALVGGGAGVAWMVHVAGFGAGFLLFPWFDGVRVMRDAER